MCISRRCSQVFAANHEGVFQHVKLLGSMDLNPIGYNLCGGLFRFCLTQKYWARITVFAFFEKGLSHAECC